jgi:hypothetical protein
MIIIMIIIVIIIKDMDFGGNLGKLSQLLQLLL